MEAATQVAPSGAQPEKQKRVRPGSKRRSVLKALLERGPRGLNRFEAYTLCHDSVLNSTVSDLRLQYGLVLDRRLETIPGYGGSQVECARYWIAPADVERVRGLLQDGEDDQ